MFHVEVRQFPHVARAFNLSSEQVQARIVGPWVRDQMIELDDRRWAPERAKLTIYEGPQLGPSDLGLGRGWGNATRTGSEVTERVLAAARAELGAAAPEAGAAVTAASAPAVAGLKERLVEEVARDRVPLARVPAMVTGLGLGVRASQRLAVAEEAVWELLHEGRVKLTEDESTIERERWEAVVLAWGSWSADPGRIFVEAET